MPARVLEEHGETTRGQVSIGTIMHQARGLEFRAVAVMAGDEVIPLQARIETAAERVGSRVIVLRPGLQSGRNE